jgi:hypothetical protein
MKKLIIYLLKSTVGRAIVEWLITRFIIYLQSQGFNVYYSTEAAKVKQRFVSDRDHRLVREFCGMLYRGELEKITEQEEK